MDIMDNILVNTLSAQIWNPRQSNYRGVVLESWFVLSARELEGIMFSLPRNGRKQWWLRGAGDPLWTSGFLRTLHQPTKPSPTPLPAPAFSSCPSGCGAPPLRNHSIWAPCLLLPHSLIESCHQSNGAEQQSQHHLSSNFGTFHHSIVEFKALHCKLPRQDSPQELGTNI